MGHRPRVRGRRFPRLGWQVIQAGIKKAIPDALIPSLETKLPVSNLDGLTVWHESRLEEEDIENVPNMATADILDLTINTRLPADRLVDWVDQAILLTAIGPEKDVPEDKSRRQALFDRGIRTATALTETYARARNRGDDKELELILPVVGFLGLRSLIDSVEINPNLPLIRAWRGMAPHPIPWTSQHP